MASISIPGAGLACLLLTPSAVAGDIVWQPNYEDALELASREGRVVFVAVNGEGDRASELAVEEVYGDRAIQALAEHTVNLVASRGDHGRSGKPCSHFDGTTCVEHRRTGASIRENLLKPDESGYVAAPQHVFLDPAGAVILSVPFEVSAGELEWCFVTALRSVDADLEPKVTARARAPKRLLVGDVLEGGGMAGVPATREEMLDLIAEHKKGARGEEATLMLLQIATCDDPEGSEYLVKVLRAGGGGGMSGEGRGVREQLIRWIGAVSPKSYWEVCAEFADAGDENLRRQAMVSLEQLGAPDSLPFLTKLLRKERDPGVKKNIVRAIGTAGATDKGARSLLLKAAKNKREDLLRVNALIALGSLAPHEDVDERLVDALREREGRDRIAAAVAMGITREARWITTLEEVDGEVEDPALKAAIAASIAVLKGAPMGTLESHLNTVALDRIERARFFYDGPEEEDWGPAEEDGPAGG